MREKAPELVWPPLLELPSDDVKLVYLDLNHWITFAQASAGHPNGVPFVDTLKACKAAKSAGTAVFVLSATHYLAQHPGSSAQSVRKPVDQSGQRPGEESDCDALPRWNDSELTAVHRSLLG